MFSRFTLRFRLTAAFAVVLLSTIVLGLFSFSRLSQVNAAAEDIANNWLPASNSLGNLSQDFELFRSRQGQVLVVNAAGRAEIMTKLAAAQKKVDADLKAYAPLVRPGKETELATAIQSTLVTYMAQDAPYRAQIDAGNIPGATDTFLHAMKPSVEALRNAIHADRDFQMAEGQKAAKQGTALGRAAKTLILWALGLCALVCFLIGSALIRGISTPVSHMAAIMRNLAGGNTSVVIPNLGETNEIGEMASAVEIFKENLIRTHALEAEAQTARENVEIQRRKIMLDLADQFEHAVGDVVQMVSSAATEMQATASQLSANAYEAAAQATTVSAAAEEAGTNVTSVASSAEELGASVQEISRQVAHSSVKARAAVKEANTTAAIVTELSESAGKINGIVELISGIAAQTNLLALNATIESARAGEAGKGFAVVASEVKTLAGQTSQATAEINAQISEIQTTTRRAVEAIGNISDTVREINDASATIAEAVDQQGAATHEIVQAVTQASIGTTEVTSNITGVARMAEETGSGASQVLSAASELAHQATHLSNQMDAFLRQVRAA